MLTAIVFLLIGYGIAHIPAARLDAAWATLKSWFGNIGSY